MSIFRLALVTALAASALAAAAPAADRSTPGRRSKAATPPAEAPAAAPAAPSPPAPAAAPAPGEPAAPAASPAPLAVPRPTMTMQGAPVAAAPVVTAPPTKAEVPELVHDAGTVERGTDIVHAFTIKNAGPNPLTVDAKPGCGCTVTDYDKIIEPGKTGRLTATVKTTTFKGPISKAVTVRTNDPDNSQFSLTIKANVMVPIDVQPSESISFNGKSGSLSPQQVTLASADGTPFDITGVTPSSPDFDVEIVPAEPEAGAAPKPGTIASGSSKYRVTLKASNDMAVGRISSSVLLRTTHPKAPELTLRLFGNVTGEIEVVPQAVTLSTGSDAPPAAKAQHVVVKKLTGEPLSILSATSNNPDVSVAVKPVSEGREYDIEVKYTGEPVKTALAAKVTLATNDPKQPSVEVQVWGRVDPGMRPPIAAAPGAAPVSLPIQAQAPPAP